MEAILVCDKFHVSPLCQPRMRCDVVGVHTHARRKLPAGETLPLAALLALHSASSYQAARIDAAAIAESRNRMPQLPLPTDGSTGEWMDGERKRESCSKLDSAFGRLALDACFDAP